MVNLEQKIEVKWSSKYDQYYKNLGYNFTKGETALIPLKYIPKGSHYKMEAVCDYCRQPYITEVCGYFNRENQKSDACKECRHIKNEQTCKERYGVEHPLQNEDFIKKSQDTLYKNYGVKYTLQSKVIKKNFENTCLTNLGVKYPMQSDIVKSKVIDTCNKKYGVNHHMKNNDIFIKAINTNKEKYGCEFPIQNSDIYEKIKNTNRQKYGVENPQQNPDIKAKTMATFDRNGTVKTSSQQIECYNMIKDHFKDVKLNYNIGSFFLDILVNVDGCMIDVEYDGWYWHNTKNSKNKDMVRDKVLQKEYNIKVLRIKGGSLLPDKNILIDKINYMLHNDTKYCEIILDDWANHSKDKK